MTALVDGAARGGASQVATCTHCQHFDNQPLSLEKEIAGLSSMSSAFGAVRSRDGICALHQRYLSAASSCAQHCPRER
jgi:hypothetical protein